ncbi:tectonic-3-like isoform 1-T1 [Odontesthes bonariensis]|uniref:tectonic-3-like isoform X1 n=1 Tax=Odontesthes bonariensis TaxID=219752 RepID=UPI003F58509C
MILWSWWSLHVLVVLCGRLAHATTELGATSTLNSIPTHGGLFTSATPAPGGVGTVDSTTVEPSEEVTLLPTLDSIVTVTPYLSEGTTEPVTEVPPATTAQTEISAQDCLCNLTPDFCDISCCCDTADCDVANLSTVFTGCPQEVVSGVCIEKWLMFRANVDSALVTVTDSLFCIRSEADDERESLPALLWFPALGDSYHFSPPGQTYIRHSRDFYRVDDVIQTYFSNSSVRGLLRQPSPGAASAFCVNRNPAKFLRSTSLSCTRTVTPQSCTTDPNLNARSYFSDLSLLTIPAAEMATPSDLLIPVTLMADWPAPTKRNNSCMNVVRKVELVIGYTGRGYLAYATANVHLADVDFDQLMLQTHSVDFQLDTPRPTPGLTPAVGLRVGSPVIGRFDEEVKPLTSLGLSQGGECSSDPSRRAPILFVHNTIIGCTFSSSARNCSELRSQIYRILHGRAAPDEIAMNSGAQPDWTRVILQECPLSQQETCESGCILPHSLSIQVLWARQGFIDLPQSYILGAKYLFQCKNVKCPLSSPLVLTTEVAFADTTVYPEPPRGLPQPHWKFPFDFFTRGSNELDNHFVTSGGSTERVTWSLMLFTVMLLTGLEFFTC